MTSGAPWSVKGIDPKVREVAKDMARRAGMTLGEWLNQVILEDGDANGDPGQGSAGRPSLGLSGFGDLSSRAASLQGRYAASASSGDDVHRVAEALDRLSARIEAAEHRSTLAISGIDQSVASLVARLTDAERDQTAVTTRFQGAVDDLRLEHAQVAERVRRFDEEMVGPRSADALRAMEGALATVASHVYEGEARTAENVDQLRKELKGVAGRVDAAASAPNDLVDGVVASFAQRLEQAEGRTTAAVRGLEDSLARLNDRMGGAETRLDGGGANAGLERLAATLSERVDAARLEMAEKIRATADGRFGRMEHTLQEMAGHVQVAERRSASAIERMGHEVLRMADVLSRKVRDAEQRSAAAIETVGGEVARIASVVETRLDRTDANSAQALEKLGGEIARITERLAERIADAERRSAQAIDDVSDQMSRFGDRLHEGQERTSSDLADRIRQSEERTARLLEDARERIDRRLAEGQQQPVSTPSGPSYVDLDVAPFGRALAAPLRDEAALVRHPTEAPVSHVAFDAHAPASLAEEAVAVAAPEPLDVSGLPDAPEILGEVLASDTVEPFDHQAFAEAADAFDTPGDFDHPSLFEQSAFTDEAFEPARFEDGALEEPETYEAALDEIDARAFQEDSEPEALDHHDAADAILAESDAMGDEGLDDLASDDVALEALAMDEGAEDDDFALPAMHDDAFEADDHDHEVFDHPRATAVQALAADDLTADEPPPVAAKAVLSTRALIEQARAAAQASSEGADRGGRRKASKASGKSLFAGFGGGAKRRHPSGLHVALVTSGAVFAASMATAGYILLNEHPSGALPARVAAALHTSRGAQTPGKELAPPMLAMALAPKPIASSPASVDATPALHASAPAEGAPELYADGLQKIDAHDASGLEAVRKSANLGYAPAEFFLAKLYETGQSGVKKDMIEARRWTERAAAGGDRKAMHNLALYYFEGAGGQQKDTTLAAQWFRRAAEAGLVDSQYNLGRLYEEGFGVAQNPAEAYKWYVIAGAAGDQESRTSAKRLRGQLSAEALAAADRAAESFQAQSDQPAGGVALASAASDGDIVKAQRALSHLGYYRGPSDGVASPALKFAIAAFQRDKNLPVTGNLDTSVSPMLDAAAH